MVSDIVLVLRSEHRDFVDLIERCSRLSRGFEDPASTLHARLGAHLSALDGVVAAHGRWLSAGQVTQVVEVLRTGIAGAPDRDATPALAQAVVGLEEDVAAQMESDVPVAQRRRVGRSFRMARDAAMRGSRPSARRVRSHAELYALAQRAGIEQRSRMTQVELQQAVEAWERSGRGAG